MLKSTQFELALNPPRDPAAPTPRITVTRVLRAHRSCNRTVEKVNYVLRYFPELETRPLRVGLTRAASGMAVPGGNEIWLNPFRISCHTIAHELVHLLQRSSAGIPSGEKSCDVYSLARHWTLNDVAPAYVSLPASLLEVDGGLSPGSARLVYEAASEALEKRRQFVVTNWKDYIMTILVRLATRRTAVNESKRYFRPGRKANSNQPAATPESDEPKNS